LKVFANFPHEPPPAPDFPVVTLGVFDGLHRGHQQILTTAFEVAAGRPVALVTFDPHPRAVLGPPKRHRLLSPIAERLQLLQRWPLAAVAILRFDREIAGWSYVDFVQTALLRGLGARHLVLGYNVTVGHAREGTGERLAALGTELGYELTLVAAVRVEGQVVSSTLIRHRLDAGDVEAAARFLGRPYDVSGTVVRGAGRGRALGIPTANLEVAGDKLLPANGVYAVAAEVGGRVHAGALNIGVVPTFQDSGERSVEVHLLDFDGDLYGSRVRLELLRRLREERRFPSPAAFQAQLQLDLQAARGAFESRPA
jgi:riboflavin kinase/FMN adenylyltransferase